MLREGQHEVQQDSTQIEVFSGLSALYPLIEQRRDSLSEDLNDKLELDSDESTIGDTTQEDTSRTDPSSVYESSLSSAQVPRRGRPNGPI